MSARKLIVSAAFMLVGVIALPVAAHAQSAIGGVVKDASGAVLPGVTVEASSDVLIEKSKSVVTDGQGAYSIVDLRPGTYLVTFTLPGFQTFKRDGLELPSNFMATVNADLKVGSLEESVTVSGQSPVVDVSTNVKAQVLPRDILDAVPTARTIQSLGQLVVGVQLSSPDVGGSRAMQQTYFVVHGAGAAQTVVTVDGLVTNGLMGDGAVQAYHNEAMVQEAVYQTAGGTGETMTGGVNMNLVPKEGGNRFTGGAKFTKSPESWQGDNLTQHLKDLGVTGVDSISNFYEYNLEQGGPLVKDKMWFYVAFRHATYDKPIANTFYTPAGVPFPIGYQQCRTNPGSCERGVSDEKMDNPIARLTWQISPRNKFAAYMDRAMRLRGHAMGSGTDPATASVVWHTPTFATGSAKWSSPVTARMLLEVGTAFNRERYDNVYQDGLAQERGTAAWYAGARKNDTSQSTLWNAAGAQLGNYPDRYSTTGAVSYVTGSHSVKTGIQFSTGTYKRWQNANADLYQTYNNGVPATVTVQNTPITSGEHLNGSVGLYVQDSWRFSRLTLNYGLRWDYLNQEVTGPAGAIRPLRADARLRRHPDAGLEELVATPVSRLRLLRQRQDRAPGGLQQVRHRGHDGRRAQRQPVRAHRLNGALVDRSERVRPELLRGDDHQQEWLRRRRAGRAGVRVPDPGLRDQPESAGGRLRHAAGGRRRSRSAAALSVFLQRGPVPRSSPGAGGDRRVDP